MCPARFSGSTWHWNANNYDEKRRSLPSNDYRAKSSSIWAIVIGIDHYHGLPALQGAVKDAHAMRNYLVDELRVPESHVALLLDNNATRRNILDTLYSHLRDNKNVRYGDAIVVYYAGLGTTYDISATDGHGDGLEAILPSDRGMSDISTSDIITDISDREIQLFLSELRDIKGENITVVMDCCFSPGISQADGVRSRFAPALPGCARSMLLAAEDNPRKRWPDGRALDGRWIPDPSSYVVILACHDSEIAEDTAEGGAFTKALLQTLENAPIYNMTYSDLNRRLIEMGQELHQTPDVDLGVRAMSFQLASMKSTVRALTFPAIERSMHLFINRLDLTRRKLVILRPLSPTNICSLLFCTIKHSRHFIYLEQPHVRKPYMKKVRAE